MRTLQEFQNLNRNNSRLNCKNIRKKAGKCGKYFTDKEITDIIEMFISKSKRVLTVTYLVYFMRYQIMYTNWVKDVYANGYLEYEDGKYGDFAHFKWFIQGKNKQELFYSSSSNADIDGYDNKKYKLIYDYENNDDYWEVVK